MSEFTADAGYTADLLARAYVDALAKAENVLTKSMLNALLPQDPVSSILGELDGPAEDDGPHLRVDLVMAAVLTAKAVSSEVGLARRLRREAPIVTIETHTAELVPLVTTIIEECAAVGNKGRLIVSRDGTERSHSPDRGNPDVIASLNRRRLTLGISSDVRRYLPNSLVRTAEYRLSIPTADEWAMRIVIEAVTGTAFSDPIDPALIRTSDLSDLSLAVRSGLTPQECLVRLARIIQEKAHHTAEGPELEELHGYGDAMPWAKDLVADLQEYKSGRMDWDLVDNTGLLLAGPPGVGKTSFVAAIAKSAGVPLIATSVAQWNAATYLSGTLQMIRDTFGQARRNAPCIMLIDEADGISDRSKLTGEFTEYWLQIVNCLLECMSGIVDNKGVVIIATTNHPDRIDAAVRRAGRLDRQITLQKPGAADLAKIFRHHLSPSLLPDVDLMPAALAAIGRTGADVEAYVKRAKAMARRARREMHVSDLLEQIGAGRAVLAPKARHRIAIHEAGHAIVGRTLKIGEFVGVSINDAGGETEFSGAIDMAMPADSIDDIICLLFGGRVAERIILGDFAIGSGLMENSDLSRAAALAEMIETKGSGKLGNLYVPDDAARNMVWIPGLMSAVKDRLDDAENRAAAILESNRQLLENVAARLEMAGYLSPRDIEEIAAGTQCQEAAE